MKNRFTITLGTEGIRLDEVILAYAHLLEDRDATFLPSAQEDSFWEALFLTVGVPPTADLLKELVVFLRENFDDVNVPSGGGTSAPGISLKEGKREEALTHRGKHRGKIDALAARILVNLDAKGLLRKDANARKGAAPVRRQWSDPIAPNKSSTCRVRGT